VWGGAASVCGTVGFCGVTAEPTPAPTPKPTPAPTPKPTPTPTSP
jgi:hypothetical protein